MIESDTLRPWFERMTFVYENADGDEKSFSFAEDRIRYARACQEFREFLTACGWSVTGVTPLEEYTEEVQ